MFCSKIAGNSTFRLRYCLLLLTELSRCRFRMHSSFVKKLLETLWLTVYLHAPNRSIIRNKTLGKCLTHFIRKTQPWILWEFDYFRLEYLVLPPLDSTEMQSQISVLCMIYCWKNFFKQYWRLKTIKTVAEQHAATEIKKSKNLNSKCPCPE